jgi:WhiB family redox-sensing transcriptional regulator
MSDLTRLPAPVTEVWDWQLRAACRNLGSEVFFHPDNERGQARAGRDAAAKAICAACPVIRECRAHALAVKEPYGVWGGLSEDDRDEIYAETVAPGDFDGDAIEREPSAARTCA